MMIVTMLVSNGETIIFNNGQQWFIMDRKGELMVHDAVHGDTKQQ